MDLAIAFWMKLWNQLGRNLWFQRAAHVSIKVQSQRALKAFAPGAMSDAPKRRMPDDSDWGLVDHEIDDESYAAIGDMHSPEEIAAFMEAHQVPVPFLNDTVTLEAPNVASWYPKLDLTNVDSHVPLPRRFQTVEQWSRVEVELPKYKGKNWQE